MAEDYKTRQIRLYKYLSPKALASFVQNHSLKLSFGYEANDRFELLPGDMLPSNDAAAREKETPEMARHGFISLTRVEDNPYMWGYYADMYRGACLEFLFEVQVDPDKETGKIRYRRLDKESPEPSQLRNIEKTCFDGNYIDICEYEINRIDRVHKDVPAYARNLITNKHVTWSQEQEYRILYSTILRNGKENSTVKGVNTGEGIIYTTADINNCAVALRVGPFCAMQVADIRRGLNSDPVLRGIRVQRAKFEECTYAVRFPEIKDKYEAGLPGDLKEELRKKGVYPMNGLGRNSFLSACRYGDKQLLQNVYENSGGTVELMDEDKNHYNGAAIALLRRSVACLDYLKEKQLKPAGLHGENLKNTVLWCASSGAESADYWLEILLDLAKKDKEEWTTWTDKYGRNPLAVAARNGRSESVAMLLKKWENMRKASTTNKGDLPNEPSAACDAASAPSKKNDEMDFLNKQDDEGRTPLMLAAWAKNSQIVDALLKKAPNLEERDRDGATVLIFAVAKSSGVNTTYKQTDDNASCTILNSLLANLPKDKLVSLCTEESTNRTALMYAHSAGYTETLKRLKEEVPALLESVKSTSDEQEDSTAFINAAKENNVKELQRLWKCFVSKYVVDTAGFVSKYVVDTAGCTPLMWSVANPNSDCSALDFLLEKLGPDALNDQDNAGCNVLMWAARKGNKTALGKILDFIRAREISLPKYLQNEDKNGMTALMWAAWKRRHEAVATIMREAEKCQKELLTQRDETGNTALDYAYKADSGEVPENTEGETKQEQAKRKTVEELCKWLSSVEEAEKE